MLDIQQVEKKSLEEIQDFINWIVPLPKNKKELKQRFNLKNDEISIEKVDFKEVEINKIGKVLIKLPLQKKEFDLRFKI